MVKNLNSVNMLAMKLNRNFFINLTDTTNAVAEMIKPSRLNAGISGVRIPGRGKCSLKTTAVDARVKYPLYFYQPYRCYYTNKFHFK